MQIQLSASARNAGNLLDGKWPRSWRERGRTVDREGAGLRCQKSLEKRKFPLWKLWTLQNGILVAEVHSSEIDIYYTSTQSHGCFLHLLTEFREAEGLVVMTTQMIWGPHHIITLSRYDGSFTCNLSIVGINWQSAAHALTMRKSFLANHTILVSQTIHCPLLWQSWASLHNVFLSCSLPA